MYLFKPMSFNFDLQVAVLVFHLENGTWIKAGLILIPKMAKSVCGPSEVVPPSLLYNGVGSGYVAPSLATTFPGGLSS